MIKRDLVGDAVKVYRELLECRFSEVAFLVTVINSFPSYLRNCKYFAISPISVLMDGNALSHISDICQLVISASSSWSVQRMYPYFESWFWSLLLIYSLFLHFDWIPLDFLVLSCGSLHLVTGYRLYDNSWGIHQSNGKAISDTLFTVVRSLNCFDPCRFLGIYLVPVFSPNPY